MRKKYFFWHFLSKILKNIFKGQINFVSKHTFFERKIPVPCSHQILFQDNLSKVKIHDKAYAFLEDFQNKNITLYQNLNKH